jgi:hypothetical protein
MEFMVDFASFHLLYQRFHVVIRMARRSPTDLFGQFPDIDFEGGNGIFRVHITEYPC